MHTAPVTSADGKETHDWKSLPQISTLDIESGLMWERADKLDQWLDQIQMESAVVSASFQTYTTWVIDTAKVMWDQYLTESDV